MKRWQWMLLAVPFALAVGLAPSGASAVPTKCSDTSDPNPDGIGTADMTFRGSNADDCFGVADGNPTETAIDDITWGDFDFVVSSDGGPVVYDGITWELTADEAVSGQWELTFVDGGQTKTYDMVAAIKASDFWSAWLFEAEEFVTDGSGTGTFVINWENPGGQNPELSHLEVYLRPVDDNGGGLIQVPEPSALLLLGSGLLGLGLVRGVITRRRRK